MIGRGPRNGESWGPQAAIFLAPLPRYSGGRIPNDLSSSSGLFHAAPQIFPSLYRDPYIKMRHSLRLGESETEIAPNPGWLAPYLLLPRTCRRGLLRCRTTMMMMYFRIRLLPKYGAPQRLAEGPVVSGGTNNCGLDPWMAVIVLCHHSNMESGSRG